MIGGYIYEGISLSAYFIIFYLIGGFIGYFMGADAVALKPLGDIFLNLMFTIVVPLVFFSIASSIANMDGLKRFGKIMSSMAGTFLFTSILAAIFMIIVVKVFRQHKVLY